MMYSAVLLLVAASLLASSSNGQQAASNADECGRAPQRLREALEYAVFRQDLNSDGIIDPTDFESDNTLYHDDSGSEACAPNCAVNCIITTEEWAAAWDCFYGFDRGYSLTVYNYLDVNRIPNLGDNGRGGDGYIVNRDVKATIIGTTRLTTERWRNELATLYRQYCAENAQGRYCDQLDTIAEFAN